MGYHAFITVTGATVALAGIHSVSGILCMIYSKTFGTPVQGMEGNIFVSVTGTIHAFAGTLVCALIQIYHITSNLMDTRKIIILANIRYN